MTDRENDLEEALAEIRQWAKAYPVEVFLPMSEADLLIARTVLLASGIRMDALHAHWARHILNGVIDICEGAMIKTPTDKTGE